MKRKEDRNGRFTFGNISKITQWKSKYQPEKCWIVYSSNSGTTGHVHEYFFAAEFKINTTCISIGYFDNFSHEQCSIILIDFWDFWLFHWFEPKKTVDIREKQTIILNLFSPCLLFNFSITSIYKKWHSILKQKIWSLKMLIPCQKWMKFCCI